MAYVSGPRHRQGQEQERCPNGRPAIVGVDLITRGNSASYATTISSCVCKGLHGWKKWNEKEYNERIRLLLPPERVALWDKVHAARYQPHRRYTYDV